MKRTWQLFQDQTVRLIYSYHPDDPVSEDSLIYHGAERRGSKSFSLLGESLPPPSLQSDDIKIFEFRTRNVSIDLSVVFKFVLFTW